MCDIKVLVNLTNVLYILFKKYSIVTKTSQNNIKFSYKLYLLTYTQFERYNVGLWKYVCLFVVVVVVVVFSKFKLL